MVKSRQYGLLLEWQVGVLYMNHQREQLISWRMRVGIRILLYMVRRRQLTMGLKRGCDVGRILGGGIL
jgi:hypothetical protein